MSRGVVRAVRTLAVTLLLACPSALAAQPAAQPTPLEGLTVPGHAPPEAQRRQIDAYVHEIAPLRTDQPLARWTDPICPLVTGLPRGAAEEVLVRVSQVVQQAGAPLAPKASCKPNFVIVVTPDPKGFARAWQKHDPGIFGDRTLSSADALLAAGRPVIVWQNTSNDPSDGSGLTGDITKPGERHWAQGSHIFTEMVRHTRGAAVIVDAKQAVGLTTRQIADYVSMTGLAEIRADASVEAFPTILALFKSERARAPRELSAWDLAYLRGLYATDPSDRTQRLKISAEIERETSQPTS
ncbi:MAG: hypothetical protein E7812_12040 [Phenylobacterium sp.]|nr:MAG: hypothetical protein E7812_12040 [Phenylobacterium sp.]